MKQFSIYSSVLLLSSCASLNDSMTLGGGLGAASGVAAMYAANPRASAQDVATSASIGLGIGLITSYLTHKHIEKKRESNPPETNFYFGDLPPSPFVTPVIFPKKKGN